MICPPTHKHGGTTTCYHDHACRCDPCRSNMTRRTRERYRLRAYGRYEGRVELTGTVRRYQGLQVLGWRAGDIAREAGFAAPAPLLRLIKHKYITPATRDKIAAAYDRLVAKGRGPSTVTTNRALAKGWVSPFAWDDDQIDDPTASPVVTERDRVLKGVDLMTEVDHLLSLGESANAIAHALNKSPENLERFAWRHNRSDIAALFTQAAKKEAA